MPRVVIRMDIVPHDDRLDPKDSRSRWVSTAHVRSATWQVTPRRGNAAEFDDVHATAWILANEGDGVRFWTESCES